MNSEKRQVVYGFNSSYLYGIVVFSICLGIFVTLFFSTRNVLEDAQHGNMFIGLSILFTFLVSISISLIGYPFFSAIVRHYSWQKHPLQRGGLMLAVATIAPALIISFWVYVFDMTFGQVKVFDHGVSVVDYFDHIVTAIIITWFVVFVYELRALYRVWRESVIEKERLKRETIEYQYNALTTQLDPHFLFNALNVLSGLVRTKDDKAIDFIDNFSDVYRYVLNSKDEVVVPLKEELVLVDKYLGLQKLRYQENLQFSIELKYDENDLLVPPLSVQLLVENAIKHNIISHTHPLSITIKTYDEMLCVLNSFQPRSPKNSNGVGHHVLEQRYGHLTDKKPIFEVKDTMYIAKIPMLHDE